jgi:tryptophan 2,3-dioxygenase
MSHPQEPRAYGITELDYNTYLKIPEMLQLQVPQSEPAHHDELLFIVIHQAYELWFKLILHEVETALDLVQKNEVLKAQHFVKRVVEIFRILVPQIHILETMRPVDFLQFRDRLNPASGFQSAQFRELEFLAGLKEERYLHFFKNRPELIAILEKRLKGTDLRSEFLAMLQRLGLNIQSIYQHPEKHLEVYLLCESLVEFDQYLGLWREHHVRVVERIIGFKQGTGGSAGVGYLRSTTSKKCFPELWEVRTELKKI